MSTATRSALARIEVPRVAGSAIATGMTLTVLESSDPAEGMSTERGSRPGEADGASATQHQGRGRQERRTRTESPPSRQRGDRRGSRRPGTLPPAHGRGWIHRQDIADDESVSRSMRIAATCCFTVGTDPRCVRMQAATWSGEISRSPRSRSSHDPRNLPHRPPHTAGVLAFAIRRAKNSRIFPLPPTRRRRSPCGRTISCTFPDDVAG